MLIDRWRASLYPYNGKPMTRIHCYVLLAGMLFCSAFTQGAQKYPVRVGADHRHLVDQDGKPYLVVGDAGWSLISGLTKEEAELYLEKRRQQGFNSIIVNLIEHKFRGPVNRYGEGPFTTPGDFSTPNEKYFAHADWVIRKAGEKGIQVFLAPIYLGYIGTDEGWIEEALANGPEKSRNWGRYVGQRYRDYDNVAWLIGGDRNPEKARVDVDAIVEGIKEFDTRHIFTAHCHPENSAIDQYKDDGWLDFNTTYTYNIVHGMLTRDYDRNPPMPFVLIESSYEGEHNASEVQVRRQAYWAILCGGTGEFMGNRPIWLFDPGWEKAVDSVGARDMTRLKTVMTSRAWYELVPDEKHEVVIDGLGEFRGLDYLAAARTSDGATLMAYLPTARSFTVDLSKITGEKAQEWWYNPRTGKSEPAGEFATGGKQKFAPPGEGDWVLIVDDASRKLPPPGRLASKQ